MALSSQIRYAFAADTSVTTGAGKTGLAFGDITAKYLVDGGTLTSLTTETISTLGTYAAPTSSAHIRIKELANTDPTKGIYEIHFHNTQLATGTKLWVFLSATGAKFQPLEIDLTDLSGRIPTALGANGNLKADVRDFNGVAGTFSGGRPEVNTTHAAGTAWGSGAITAASIAASALNGKGDWNIGKTGYTLTQAFPANFAALGINASGHVSRVTLTDTLTTYTGNTPQTGNNYSFVPAIYAYLQEVHPWTEQALAVMENAGYGNAALKTLLDAVTLYVDAIPADVRLNLATELARIDVATSTRLAAAGYTAPDNATISTISTNVGTLLTRIPAALFAGITSLAEWLGLLAGKQTGNTTARNELRDTGVGSGTYLETTDSLESIRDRGDAAWTTGGGGGGGGDVTSLGGSTDALEALKQTMLEGAYASFAAGGYLAITHIATVSGVGATGISVTSSAADTTGATYGIAFVSSVSAIAASTVTDSKGNTWTKQNDLTNPWIRGAWYDCLNPTVGASHTLSTNAIGNSPAIFGFFFANVRQAVQIDQSASHNSGTGTTFSTGGVTPTEDNELIIAFAAIPATNPAVPTIGSGFTEVGYSSNSVGNNVGGCAGYLLQTTAAEVDPTFASNGGTVPDVCFLLSLFPQQDVPSITLSSFADGRIFQREPGKQSAALSFSGTYDTGGDDVTPAEIEVIVYEHGTTTVVQEWAPIDNPTISGGNWSGTLSVPCGGWYCFAARSRSRADAVVATSATTTAKTGVGVLIAIIGQSNGEKMFQNFTSLTANTRTRYYNGAWAANDGDGAIVLSDLLQQALNMPIGLLRYAVSGTGLIEDAGLGNGYWLDETPGEPYPLFETGLTAVGGECEFILWAQGEADAYTVQTVADYKAGLTTLYGRILDHTGRGRGALKMGVYIMARLDDGTNQSCTDIRTALAQWALETEGAFIAGSAVDSTLVDAYHYNGPSYQRLGRRYAQSILHQMGLAAFSGAGPRVVEAQLRNDEIWLRVEHNSGGTALTGSDGLEVSDDSFATNITISSVRFDDNWIVLALSQTPLTAKVRGLYGKLPTITNVIRDNSRVMGETAGCPLIPFDALDAVVTDPRLAELDLTTELANGGTVGDALEAALAQGYGKWVLNSSTKILTMYAPDGTTVVKQFLISPTLDGPLSRTPQ